HSGNFGGRNGHMSRGDHRILAAGDVATVGIHRDVLMAENNTRKGLDLDVPERRLLLLGKIANLFLSKFDIVNRASWKLRDALPNLLVRQAIVGPVPPVEFDRELAHRFLAPLRAIGEG